MYVALKQWIIPWSSGCITDVILEDKKKTNVTLWWQTVSPQDVQENFLLQAALIKPFQKQHYHYPHFFIWLLINWQEILCFSFYSWRIIKYVNNGIATKSVFCYFKTGCVLFRLCLCIYDPLFSPNKVQFRLH